MRRLCLFVGMLAASMLAGCYEPVAGPQMVPYAQQPAQPLPAQRYVAGNSVRNRPVECIVLGRGRDVLFVLGAIHGNEPTGTTLVRRFETYLRAHPELLLARKVVLLPMVNPDGCANHTRHNIRGVDLNRNFAAANRINGPEFGPQAFSEPEARTIRNLIQIYSPDRIISIHQPLACIDYDGPAENLARQMAQRCNLPVRKLGARSGSLGSYAGPTLGIPIITLELAESDTRATAEQLWNRYGQSMIAALLFSGQPY